MRLSIIAVGRLKDGPERDLCTRYHERATGLSRNLGFSGPDLLEIAESRGRRSEERRSEEARLIGERLPAGLVIALDERGKSFGSEAFAGRLAAARDAGTPAATLLIGGADGLAEELR
ncbi:MAG: 23S rRNA (pseudouridine(1915)-N(3))-methyltransferase RlmH, partial [Bosea sp.]|nr:23S rRNA (pseudouridine(1915)-N(3))-methyltransferase RlmH [Bosea sp. (in: a-proteobacteria)]